MATISIKRLPKRELDALREELRLLDLTDPVDVRKPHTRADCLQGEHAERPCPFVSCKHHLYLEVSNRTGSVRLNFPELEVWELPESCALDVADRGGATLEAVGAVLNLTRERIRQLEEAGLARVRALSDLCGLMDWME